MAAKYQYAILVVVALVGGMFILGGFLSKDQSWTNVLTSVGTSILATAIVSGLIRVSLGDPTETMIKGLTSAQLALEAVIVSNVRVIERASATGLVSIWSARQELTVEAWIERMRRARSEIKLLAYAMAFLPDHPEFVKILEERAGAGCRVQIVVGDPHSKAVTDREIEENENIISRIHTVINRTRRLIGRPGFHLRMHGLPLYCSIYLFDDELFVTPHLFGLRGAAAPLLHIRRTPGGLFAKYERHFDDVWQQAVDVAAGPGSAPLT